MHDRRSPSSGKRPRSTNAHSPSSSSRTPGWLRRDARLPAAPGRLRRCLVTGVAWRVPASLTQHDHVIELAEIEETPPATAWQIANLPAGDEEIAVVARRGLLSNAPLPLPTRGDKPYDHLNAWVAALEEAGVLVLATERGGVSTNEMRAFSLYFDVVPVIVVNGSDGARGRLFSLAHEYAHLLMHTVDGQKFLTTGLVEAGWHPTKGHESAEEGLSTDAERRRRLTHTARHQYRGRDSVTASFKTPVRRKRKQRGPGRAAETGTATRRGIWAKGSCEASLTLINAE